MVYEILIISAQELTYVNGTRSNMTDILKGVISLLTKKFNLVDLSYLYFRFRISISHFRFRISIFHICVFMSIFIFSILLILYFRSRISSDIKCHVRTWGGVSNPPSLTNAVFLVRRSTAMSITVGPITWKSGLSGRVA